MNDAETNAERPLRVGLNLMFLGERAGGAGRYAMELPGALLAAEPRTEVHVFVSRDAPRALAEQPWIGEVRIVTLPVPPRLPLLRLPVEFGALPVLARARRLDVLHSPANTGPVVAPGVASVVSLLDLIWLHNAAEWEASVWVQRRMRLLVNYCVRHADRIFAISRAAAVDFERTLGIDPSRVDVTPLGVAPREQSINVDPERSRRELDLGTGRVVLCIAQKRPYKNLHSLVRALPYLAADVLLVLPGAPTPYEDELRALAKELGVGERVRFAGWLSDTELDDLYAAANVFALPSLIEGFGIPVLEAMARGLPVACSNVSALPEVAGSAALLFDPRRQEEVTAAIGRLLEDRAFALELVARGYERVRQFSWQRTGEASLAGYRRALAASGDARG